ncbi:hypothetical protein T4D_4352 [Trichinella pseudospiralis]|uniref:Spondin-1 n=1 Tax=Trichinella pseudospiralis TaxID=6337 RepID=A0A0V1FFU9_TRIPS|nr:hypothetical protein T4D_4352 [Trichinella pseudospiralis]
MLSVLVLFYCLAYSLSSNTNYFYFEYISAMERLIERSATASSALMEQIGTFTCALKKDGQLYFQSTNIYNEALALRTFHKWSERASSSLNKQIGIAMSIFKIFATSIQQIKNNILDIQSEITTNTSEVIKIAQTALFNSSSVINQNSAFALKNSANCHKCQFNKNVYPAIAIEEARIPYRLRNRTKRSATETVYPSAVTENGIPDSAQNKTSVLDKQMEALKELHKVPATRSNLYGYMRNPVVSSMNSLDGVIIKPLLSLGNPNETDDSTHIIKPNIVLKRPLTASTERTVTSPSSTEGSSVTENGIPDSRQNKTSVLDKQMEALKELHKVSATRSNLYGNMQNSVVSSMNSLDGVIIKPLLSLGNPNEIDNFTHIIKPNIVLKRSFTASNERTVTSPSATEDSNDQSGANTTVISSAVSKNENEISASAAEDSSEQRKINGTLAPSEFSKNENEPSSTLTTSSIKVPDNVSAEMQVEFNGTELLLNVSKIETETSVLETTDVTEQSETVASVQLTSIPQEKNETFTSTSSLTTSSVQVPDEASAEAQEEINGTVPLSNIAKNASETLTSSTVSGKVSNETSPTAEALQNLTSTRLFSETYFYGFCFANRCAFECSAVNQWSYWTPCSGVPGKSFEQRMRVLAFLDRDNTSCFMALEMRKCNMVKSVAECKYSTWNAWSECTGPCNNRTRTRTREVIWPTSLIRHNCNVQALSETRSCPSTCLHEFVEKACDQTANINGVHGINKTRWYYLCGEKPILAQCGKNDGARFLVDVVNIAQTIQFLNGHQFSPVRIFASTIRQTFLRRLPLGSADHSFDVLLSTELQSLAKQFVHTSSESVF